MDTRACTKCGEDKPLTAFYKHPFGLAGRMSKCAECTKAAVRANRSERLEYYRAYERERAKLPHRVKARTEYAAKHKAPPRPEPDPIKRKARVTLGNAVRDGRIAKPPQCEVCGQSEPLHGHHDDYTKPLDVIWCCTACHALIHAYWRAQERSAA
jgi:hypothetical protein